MPCLVGKLPFREVPVLPPGYQGFPYFFYNRSHECLGNGPTSVVPPGARKDWALAPEVLSFSQVAPFMRPVLVSSARDPRHQQLTNADRGVTPAPARTTPARASLRQCFIRIKGSNWDGPGPQCGVRAYGVRLLPTHRCDTGTPRPPSENRGGMGQPRSTLTNDKGGPAPRAVRRGTLDDKYAHQQSFVWWRHRSPRIHPGLDCHDSALEIQIERETRASATFLDEMAAYGAGNSG